MKKVIDLLGNRYGLLTVIEFSGFSASGNAMWKCACDCGNQVIVLSGDLRRKRPERKSGGGTKSCGCLRVTEPAKANKRHGMFGTRIYGIWNNMRQRCENGNSIAARNYKERGISVCDEWSKFEPFYAWATSNGYSDSLTIDRIDNNKGYSPDNCRFISMYEQQSNKRTNVMITARGETKTIAQWCRSVGIDSGTFHSRLKSGWSTEEAIFTKVGRSR